MKKLNVGCGTDYREGWVNLDFNKKFKTDVTFDLNKIYGGGRLPFKDNTFDLIILYDVLEHFPEPLPILRELYRICRKGGIIDIKVPYGDWVWMNLDHKHQFFLGSFDVINFDDYVSGGDKKVEFVYRQLYFLPTNSILKKIVYKIFLGLVNPMIKRKYTIYDQTPLRFIFQKTNINVKYKKVA